MNIVLFYRYCIVLLCVALAPNVANAQRFGISTDAIKWATLSPNLEIDVNINQTSSLSFKTSFNPINFSDNFRVKHISIAPEYKYWLQQIMSGHYLAVEGRFTTCDLVLKDKSWRGDILSVGLNYGYSFIINNRFNIVPHIGMGYGIKRGYDIMEWSGSGIIPQLGINLQYIIYNPKR